MTVGIVSAWWADDGWGVIESEQTPGGCWAHFSVIAGVGAEVRSLTVGQWVTFTWEELDEDGFGYRATEVGQRSPNAAPASHGLDQPAPAYRSRLTIDYPDDTATR